MLYLHVFPSLTEPNIISIKTHSVGLMRRVQICMSNKYRDNWAQQIFIQLYCTHRTLHTINQSLDSWRVNSPVPLLSFTIFFYLFSHYFSSIKTSWYNWQWVVFDVLTCQQSSGDEHSDTVGWPVHWWRYCGTRPSGETRERLVTGLYVQIQGFYTRSFRQR